MSLYRNTYFILHGLSEFTKGGYDKAAKSFNKEALNVDWSDKVAAVTGANSGIGKEVALGIAQRGGTVYLLCRSAQKAEEARREIIEKTQNQKVFVRIVDLSDLRGISVFAQQFVSEVQRLDVLVNNGGAMNDVREETRDGIETNFAANTLGTFHLTTCLMELLQKSAPSRVVTVSSGGMLTMKLDSSDLNCTKNPSNFDGTFSYAANKRQQVVLTDLWTKKYSGKGVEFYSCHPGWADTEGVRKSMPNFYDNFKEKLRTATEGADTVLWLAIAAEVPQKVQSGDFVQDRKAVKKHLPLAWTHHSEADEEVFWLKIIEFVNKATSPIADASNNETTTTTTSTTTTTTTNSTALS